MKIPLFCPVIFCRITAANFIYRVIVANSVCRTIATVLQISEEQAGISEAEKSVSFFYRFAVYRKRLLSAAESGNEHEKSGFGQVKVCNERVHSLEFIRRIYENFRFTVRRSECTVVLHSAFKYSDRRSTHANYAFSRLFCRGKVLAREMR